MSGAVLIISIPTEEHEKCLLKKLKKKVTIEDKPEIITPNNKSDNCTVFLKKDPGPCGNEDSEMVFSSEYQSMEKIIKSTLEDLEIADTTWTKTEDKNHHQIIFPIECGDKCEEILDILREHDIGTKLNSKISVMPCTIQYHGHDVKEHDESSDEENSINDKDKESKNSGWNLFVSSVRSRLTVAQVVENVKARAAMTFDFIMLLLISTILCALGLVENNNIYMLSSMLISPMMGPVMAGTFGTVIRDKHLQKVGVQNELIGLGIATLVGFFYGSIICIATDRYGTQDWPTYEMYSRGKLRSLWVEGLIAILSGAAVALGLLSDNISSLVGVAISTSLMPPAVNTGLLWSLGFVYYLKHDNTTRYVNLTHTDFYSTNSGTELTTLGAVSICLTFINIICIYTAGIIVLKIKEVAPNTTRDQARKKFWKHDIKVARDHNKTIFNDDSPSGYQRLLEEISGDRRRRDLHRLSTDLSRNHPRIRIKRSEYTWSPCCSDAYNMYESLTANKTGNLPRKLNFSSQLPLKRDGKSQHRRLSQIFPRPSFKDDNLKPAHALITEKTPLLQAGASTTPLENTYFMSSGKKIVVTPCNLNNSISAKS